MIVKLTPNITRHSATGARARGRRRGRVSLINTIKSIVAVDLDLMAPEPVVDGKGTHGGYCGPAVKPIALHMVAEIARDPEMRGLPISGIGGISTWRDAAEFIALGAGTVQVCTAAMHYGFRIVEDLIDGLSNWMDEKGLSHARRFPRPRGAELRDWSDLNLNSRHRAHRSGPVHPVRAVPYRLRGHLAPGHRGAARGRQAAL